MEPRERVELATCRLRIGCSTTELPRLRTENYISIRGKLLSIYQRIGRSFSRSQTTAKCLRDVNARTGTWPSQSRYRTAERAAAPTQHILREPFGDAGSRNRT